MTDNLQTPLSEIEMAELANACREFLSTAGMMRLRRLAFERDALKAEIARLEMDIDGREKGYQLQLKGMESMTDLMDAMKQENRTIKAELAKRDETDVIFEKFVQEPWRRAMDIMQAGPLDNADHAAQKMRDEITRLTELNDRLGDALEAATRKD